MRVMGRLDDYPRLRKYQDQLSMESFDPISDAEADVLRDQFRKAACVNGSEGVAVNGESFALIEILIQARVPISILDRYIDAHDLELERHSAGAEDTP